METIAANLAMAGGRPEYLPVLMAVIEAISAPWVGQHKMSASTISSIWRGGGKRADGETNSSWLRLWLSGTLSVTSGWCQHRTCNQISFAGCRRCCGRDWHHGNIWDPCPVYQCGFCRNEPPSPDRNHSMSNRALHAEVTRLPRFL